MGVYLQGRKGLETLAIDEKSGKLTIKIDAMKKWQKDMNCSTMDKPTSAPTKIPQLARIKSTPAATVRVPAAAEDATGDVTILFNALIKLQIDLMEVDEVKNEEWLEEYVGTRPMDNKTKP